ncbi:MAG: DUF4252 domain-containing protein [Candidatus Saccharimonadaceae bacterium]
MKRLILIFVVLISFAGVFGQNNPLKKYADAEGLTSMVVTKNMLSMFPKNSNMEYKGIKIGEFLEKITSINIYSSKESAEAAKLLSFANKLMKTPEYEMLMGVKTEDKENVDLFIRGNAEHISEFVVIGQGKSKETAVMQFLGNFTLEDIQQMIEKANK